MALGFGISTPVHANNCACAGADGIIIGSVIVKIVDRNLSDPGAMILELQDFIQGMKWV
ncbi:MAG: tryptophan synthase subunit alpha [Methanomicrobiales archaeon]